MTGQLLTNVKRGQLWNMYSTSGTVYYLIVNVCSVDVTIARWILWHRGGVQGVNIHTDVMKRSVKDLAAMEGELV